MTTVLVACEFSGIVRDAFIRHGADAMSCDLLPTRSPGPHYEGDVRDVLDSGEWDLMIAHPDCTFAANSGGRWLYKGGRKENGMDPARWRAMWEGTDFFRLLLDAPIRHKAIENPVIHRYAAEAIGRRWTQTVQPWQFGHGEIKRICLWLDNLPVLEPTNVVDGREPRIHHMAKSDDRGLLRSIFYEGIADAMASQWLSYIRGAEA